ncbi:2827_t:CDS:2, partial [Cetraspora pellucida]
AIAFKDNKYKKQKVDNTNKIIHSETLNIHRDKLSEITNMNVSRRCGVCGQAGHNSRTCHEHNNLLLSLERYNAENPDSESMDKNLTSHANISRCCGICGQVGHNARTYVSQDENINYEADDSLLSVENNIVNVTKIADRNITSHDNKSHHCSVCGQT